ncbi:hypothetical protein [Paraburkholderia sp. J11-2]|uniref:hypothetical protein n=1 Tax=Paraburkholderia sp. J11-2 TaxID=2805431 RepID=UPI002AB6836F|nr:hypothetical protein [Paraburkholderia sp. J11-2]
MYITKYSYCTNRGTISIELRRDGRWEIFFGRENLGSYPSARSAADDLFVGSVPLLDVDPSRLGIPGDLADWTPGIVR